MGVSPKSPGSRTLGFPLIQEENESDQFRIVDFKSEYEMNNHEFPSLDVQGRLETHSSDKKKKLSQHTNSETVYAQNAIVAPHLPQYLVGAAIAPAIIPLTTFDHVQNINPNPSSLTNGNSKKHSSNTRSKPINTPSKKTPNDSHKKIMPFNAVPLVWYPPSSVYNRNLPYGLSSSHRKFQPTTTTTTTTKLPVISQLQSQKQYNQVQAINLAAYYAYLNRLNSKQKHPE